MANTTRISQTWEGRTRPSEEEPGGSFSFGGEAAADAGGVFSVRQRLEARTVHELGRVQWGNCPGTAAEGHGARGKEVWSSEGERFEEGSVVSPPARLVGSQQEGSKVRLRGRAGEKVLYATPASFPAITSV